jgi:MFS family permease
MSNDTHGTPPETPPETLWHHQDFMRFWAGQSVSQIGSAITTIALPLAAIAVLKASAFEVGLLTAATYTAFIFIALPAGAIVDRHFKRKIMIWCDAARLVIIGSVPVATLLGVLTMAQLFAVALVAGVFTVFFDVSYQSYVPVLLGRDRLLDGNGKLGASRSVAQVAGPGLAGVLVGLAGVVGAVTADAFSYLVSVASLLLIRTPESPPERAKGNRRSLRADIADGLGFVWRHRDLRRITACSATGNLFVAMEMSLSVLFLVRVVHVSPALTGLLIALASLGGVAGAVLSGPLARRIGTPRILWFAPLVFGLPNLFIPLARPGWGVVLFPVGSAASAFSSVIYNVSQLSYRQAACPPELLGRMSAAIRWVAWGALPLGGLLAGLCGSVAGIRLSLAIAVSGYWAAGLLIYFSPLRTTRKAATVPSARVVLRRLTVMAGLPRARAAGRAAA